jgi:hypothetical protein
VPARGSRWLSGSSGDAEEVRDCRLDALGGEHEPVDRLDPEAFLLDRECGVAGGVTAAVLGALRDARR